MVNALNVRGVIRPMVTPFAEKNRIDLEVARRVADFLLPKGVGALMIEMLRLKQAALCRSLTKHNHPPLNVQGRVCSSSRAVATFRPDL